MIPAADTFVDLLRWRAAQHPDRRAFTFLPDGEREAGVLTYGAIDDVARAVAAGLRARGFDGAPVLLLYPSGLEFITAFAGCLYAGSMAIPAMPPQAARHLSRLVGLVQDAQPGLVLTTPSVLARVAPLLASAGLDHVRWTTQDEIAAPESQAWQRPALEGRTIAFLQYTSGSTADPRGVMVSHRNLLSNQRMIERAFDQRAEGPAVTWLPFFHDMGLVGNLLNGLYLGAERIVMPPEAFLMKPARWLQAITRYEGQQCGGPTFAYELCVERITAEQKATLDLSSWRTAYVGAEPVRAAVLERFADAFAPCGFERRAFHPCYGLAEATLFAAGGQFSADLVIRHFRARALEDHNVAPALAGDADARALVGCGRGWLDQEIAIVDPNTHARCKDNRVGEIWIAGSHVAEGYWRREPETAHTFQARISGEREPRFLRTGDLGFFHDGQLFVAGRLKDLIIMNGRNHHPADIEQTVRASHPAVQRGHCAAFSVDADNRERLVVVAELERSWRAAEAAVVTPAIRHAVAAEHDLTTHQVVLVKPASVPRTSSGKVQRQLCRERFLAGALDAWAGGR